MDSFAGRLLKEVFGFDLPAPPDNEEEFDDVLADNLSEIPSDADTDSEVDTSDDETDYGPTGPNKRLRIHAHFAKLKRESTKDDVKSLKVFKIAPEAQIHEPLNKKSSIVDILKVIFDDEKFFKDILVKETNRYHEHNSDKLNFGASELNVDVREMKRFISLIVLMSQVRKSHWHHYWSDNPIICTPFFSKLMNMPRFSHIWKCWHFNDLKLQNGYSDRSDKIKPIVDYFSERFRAVYTPKSVFWDSATIPWRGRFRLRPHNSSSTRQSGLVVRTLTEINTNYIYDIKIHSIKSEADEKKELTLYKDAEQASTSQPNASRVKLEYENFNTNRLLTPISDNYLLVYSILNKRTELKWSKKVLLCVLNCAFFNAYKIYRFNNPNSKLKYHKFLLKIVETWSEVA